MDEKTKRPHTINGSNGSMHQRPGLNGHTFMPTNSNVSFNEFPSGFIKNSLHGVFIIQAVLSA